MRVSQKIKLNILNKSALIVTALIISSCSNSLTTKEASITDEIKQQKAIIKLYTQKLLKDPNNEKLIFDRGIAKYEYGDYKGAINDFDNAFQISNDDSILYLRAITKFEYGDYEGAIDDYTILLSIPDLRREIYLDLGLINLYSFNYKKALLNFNKVIEEEKSSYRNFLNRGNINFRLRNYKDSKKDYDKSVELFNKSYLSLNNRGVSNYKEGNFKQSLKDFNRSLKLNPGNYNTLFNRALTYNKLNLNKKACIDLKKSIKLGKDVFKEDYSSICYKN